MRVQVPHDAQKAGGLQVAGFSYPCPTSPLFSSVDRSPARSAACHSPARSATTAAARPPPAPRASLGASARSPARPRRPRVGLRSGGSWRAFPLPSQALTPHAAQNSPSRHTTPVSRPFFTSGRSEGVECATEQKGITCPRSDRTSWSTQSRAQPAIDMHVANNVYTEQS